MLRLEMGNLKDSRLGSSCSSSGMKIMNEDCPSRYHRFDFGIG